MSNTFMKETIKRIITESRFLPQPSSVLQDIGYILNFLSVIMRGLTYQQFRKIVDNPGFVIKYRFVKTSSPINIQIGKFGGHGKYEHKDGTVYIDLEWMRWAPKEDLRSTLVHEITHALSKRIPNVSEKYFAQYDEKLALAQQVMNHKLPRKEAYPYYQDPEEFDARGAEIATYLLERQCTRENVAILDTWIRGGGMIRKTPSFLIDWRKTIAIWARSLPLYKRFLSRMFDLIEQMKVKLNL